MINLRILILSGALCCCSAILAQTHIAGALPSYNVESHGKERVQQCWPEGGAFVCENGTNRFTRALYGSHTDWRLETSDRPVFAVVKKNHHRSICFVVSGVPLDSTDYCRASYHEGIRSYVLTDRHWGNGRLRIEVLAHPSEEMALWHFQSENSYAMPY